MQMAQMEATVPQGVAPGETFTAQTPAGLVPVVVPPGAMPGQKIRFAAPTPQSDAPVLLGTVVGGTSGLEASKPYRTDPVNASVANIPLLQGIPVDQAESKVKEIHRGADIAHQNPAFPERRRYRDAFWIVPFGLAVAAVVVAAFVFADDVEREFQQAEVKTSARGLWGLVSAGLAGAAGSLVAAMGYAVLANRCPGLVVWTSLIFGPCLMIAMGLVFIGTGSLWGLLFIGLGALSLGMVFCFYRILIPFMIKLLEVISGIMRENPGMLAVSVACSVVNIAWTIVCGLAFAGAYFRYKDTVDQSSQGVQYVIYFCVVLIVGWGSMVCFNVAHVTYCGVFGRWYHGLDGNKPVIKSLGVALTTSFGSICFGSFLVALIRAVEAVVSKARRDAQADGNIVCCIILLVVQCIISCIGDILEYFSEWAYVQCAVRGVNFIEAARITYSMMTCANLEYLLQDLLLNSVVNLGALLCGAVGCGIGAVVGATMGQDAAIAGAIIGFYSGLVAGGAAVGILSSGTKAVLACWAEDGEPLRRMRPTIHAEFEARIIGKLEKAEQAQQ